MFRRHFNKIMILLLILDFTALIIADKEERSRTWFHDIPKENEMNAQAEFFSKVIIKEMEICDIFQAEMLRRKRKQ